MEPLYKIKVKSNNKGVWQYIKGDWTEFRLVRKDQNATQFTQDDLNDILSGLNPKQIVVEKVV